MSVIDPVRVAFVFVLFFCAALASAALATPGDLSVRVFARVVGIAALVSFVWTATLAIIAAAGGAS